MGKLTTSAERMKKWRKNKENNYRKREIDVAQGRQNYMKTIKNKT